MSRYANSRRLLVAATAATGIAVAAVMGGSAAMADTATEPSSSQSEQALQCEKPDKHDPEVTATIYDVAEQRGVDDKVLLATFETGWVTSHMNNLDCGDKSLGVFHTQPGSELCDTAEQCLDVTVVSNNFLDLAETASEDHPDATAGELAAIVMHSAYPNRYDEAEPKALELIDEASRA